MKKTLFTLVAVLAVLVGTAIAKQWDEYTDMGTAPAPTDTLLIYDVSESTDADKLKETTVRNFFAAFELAPVYVDLAGTSIYTIDLSLGNTFFVNLVGTTGNTGVSVYMPAIQAGTSQYANRPYWVVNNTVSGTTKVWLVPQYSASQCTQWIVAGTGVTTSQSGVSQIGHERMDSRMDAVMVLPRYVSATGGATHYVMDETIH